MINADKARHDTHYYSGINDNLNLIEKDILKAIKNGKFSVSYSILGGWDHKTIEFITKELTELGYKVDYKPLDEGPADQVGWYAYLMISWDEE